MNNSASEIKRSQKESLFLKEISKMFHEITLDEDRLHGLFVNRVELSSDKSWCTIYFYTTEGYQSFQSKLDILKLYKPSIRKGLATSIQSRYVPDLRFAYDAQFEKQQRLESIISKVSEDLHKQNEDEDTE